MGDGGGGGGGEKKKKLREGINQEKAGTGAAEARIREPSLVPKFVPADVSERPLTADRRRFPSWRGPPTLYLPGPAPAAAEPSLLWKSWCLRGSLSDATCLGTGAEQ